MESLIIIVSLGRVRPLHYKKTDDDPLRPKHLVEAPDLQVEIKHEPLGTVVTDQAGRFTHSPAPGQEAGMSYGEEKNLKAELEEKALQTVAQSVSRIVAQEAYPNWRLFAPAEIMPRLLNALSAQARAALTQTEKGDYTKVPIMELEKRLVGSS